MSTYKLTFRLVAMPGNKGLGLVADEKIAYGTFVGEYLGATSLSSSSFPMLKRPTPIKPRHTFNIRTVGPITTYDVNELVSIPAYNLPPADPTCTTCFVCPSSPIVN